MRLSVKMIANIYFTYTLMLLTALAAMAAGSAEGRHRIVPHWRVPLTALLATLSALVLVAYPTWGALRNPGLWMFAILAGGIGVARGYWMRIDVDHTWGLLRFPRGYDSLAATGLLVATAGCEIALAAIGPADQPTMELGMTMTAAFLVGRAGAVLLRIRNEPQADLHDHPSPLVGR
jgi:uncharacterized membrane protein AbrB (regulator of aidB expression)